MIMLKYLGTSGPRQTATYEIMNDEQVVGEIQLRHIPSKSPALPEGFESHIYYEIKPEFQGKGFAKEALRLVLEEARKANLSEVTLTVAENNIASQRVVEANGGEMVKSAIASDGAKHLKYRIVL